MSKFEIKLNGETVHSVPAIAIFNGDSVIIKWADEPVSTGKLTGLQLRTIAAKDQLESLLDDRCFFIIKELAEAIEDDFQYILKCAGESGVSAIQKLYSRGDMDTPDIRMAIRAMALFCYTEIIERGLKKPGQIE